MGVQIIGVQIIGIQIIGGSDYRGSDYRDSDYRGFRLEGVQIRGGFRLEGVQMTQNRGCSLVSPTQVSGDHPVSTDIQESIDSLGLSNGATTRRHPPSNKDGTVFPLQ